jgi:hypothetical protein
LGNLELALEEEAEEEVVVFIPQEVVFKVQAIPF